MLPHRLICLGTPHLVGPDGEPIRLRTRKHLALLVWLCREPSIAHRRDRLATLFWPRPAIEEARHSLVTAISMMRGKIGRDAFETTRETIRLLPGYIVTDLEALEREDPLETDDVPIAPFLEEFEIPRVPDFSLWVDAERNQTLPVLQRHLSHRIDRCRQTGDTRRMGEIAALLQRIDPLSEHAIRAQMESAAMAGDRLAALRTYQHWREDLNQQLGAVPSVELERFAERLRRRGVTGPTHKLVASVPTEQWKERVFVGRGVEFEKGYEVWQRVQDGEPKHLLVRGESGVGKTMLAERLATSIALEGASAARVQCYELERELPFGMIGGLVAQLLDLPGAAATAPEQLGELGRLVAKVGQRWPSLPEPSTHTGESARILFTEAVMALMESISDEQPLIVLVDDIHLADATSLAVLHLILRRLDSIALMVILTSPLDAEAIPEAASRLVLHPESVRMTPLVLDPLPALQTTKLLAELLAGEADPGPTVRRALLAGAKGNPMILELLVGDWKRDGDSSMVLSMTSLSRGASTQPRHTFQRLVDGMLAGMDGESRSVANLGAILGNRLNDLSMYTLVDLPIARTMRAMSTLTSNRILRDAGTHLEFANEMVRGQCYVAMATPLRRMLHSLVADRLLGQGQTGESVPGLEVAWHLVRADRLTEAVPYLLAGGKESIRRGAAHEADLALSTGLPALEGDAQRQAVLLLAEALQELGRWGESLRVLEGSEYQFNEEEYALREVMSHAAQYRTGEMNLVNQRDAFFELQRTIVSPFNHETRVRAAATSVSFLNQLKDSVLSNELASGLQTIAVEQLDSYQLLYFYLAHAWTEATQYNHEAAIDSLRQGVAVAESSGYFSAISIRLLIGLANTLSVVGDYRSALPIALRAHQLSTRLDNADLMRIAAFQAALASGRLGNSLDQILWAEEGLKQTQEAPWSTSVLGLTYELGLGLAARGKKDEAISAIRRLSASLPSDPPKWSNQGAALFGADIAAVLGMKQRALSLAGEVISSGLLDSGLSGVYARWKAVIAIKTGQEASALNEFGIEFNPDHELHSKDLVEVLAARAILEERVHGSAIESWARVQDLLERLPRGVQLTMRASGVLQA